MENSYEDDNPITNPFYYAQNMDAVYETEIQRLQKEMEEEQSRKNLEASTSTKEIAENKKKSKLSLKRTILKPETSTCAAGTSYVIRKETKKAHHIIKISIEEITGTDLCQTNINNTNISAQYLVKDSYDEILNDTEKLIGKIVKNLSSVDAFYR